MLKYFQIGLKKQNNTLSFFNYFFIFHMNSTEVRLKQFKPTMKSLLKVWHDPFLFEVLQVPQKVHKAHCTEEAIFQNSKYFSKFSAFSFKKASFQQKNGASMPIFQETDQNNLDRNQRAKVSSVLEDMVRSAVTIHKIFESLRNSVWEMLKGMCGISKIYEVANCSFPN